MRLQCTKCMFVKGTYRSAPRAFSTKSSLILACLSTVSPQRQYPPQLLSCARSLLTCPSSLIPPHSLPLLSHLSIKIISQSKLRVIIREDNRPAVNAVSTPHTSYLRLRHIACHYHFVRELFDIGIIDVVQTPAFFLDYSHLQPASR